MADRSPSLYNTVGTSSTTVYIDVNEISYTRAPGAVLPSAPIANVYASSATGMTGPAGPSFYVNSQNIITDGPDLREGRRKNCSGERHSPRSDNQVETSDVDII